ncbi:MAG: Mini-ribonuclease 3 [Clostridia bacterium]|nr:Mini-ribonuclease 3 [Clostridia bacterium]
MQDNVTNRYTGRALAYIGDCVFELCVRRYLVEQGIAHSAKLNKEALGFVTATRQASYMEGIREMLTEEEDLVCRRGKNMSHNNIPKSASKEEYSHATELEVLFGYLYLSQRQNRIDELFSRIVELHDL